MQLANSPTVPQRIAAQLAAQFMQGKRALLESRKSAVRLLWQSKVPTNPALPFNAQTNPAMSVAPTDIAAQIAPASLRTAMLVDITQRLAVTLSEAEIVAPENRLAAMGQAFVVLSPVPAGHTVIFKDASGDVVDLGPSIGVLLTALASVETVEIIAE